MWEDVEMDFFRKNFIHLTNFFNYILEHLMCILIILTILILSGILLINLPINNPENIETQQILIFGVSLENWSVWYTAIGLIIGAVWSIYQFSKNKILKQQEKASEIASEFSNNLIGNLGLISKTLLKNNDIKNMLKTLKDSNVPLNQFTKYEIEEIFEDNQIFEKFEKIIMSDKTQKDYSVFLSNKYSLEEQKNFPSKFPVLIETTLNRLEAICINISSQAAGSQFIYDSLHQYFLMTIEILSIMIASNNINNIDKYYTNIIQVYNMWERQKNSDIEKLNKITAKINRIHKKLDKEVKKLLSKEAKTV